MSLVHNEQTKLTATALNNTAVAFLVAGFVAPPINYAQQPEPLADRKAVILNLTWLVVGSILL
jgi:hypothetical protein